MAIGYGSNFKLPRLTSEEIGREIFETEDPLEVLSILLNLAEVGLSLIPGVGTAAATVLALGNATAQTEIQYAQTGEVSGLTAGLSFGSALLPGLSAGVSNIRAFGNIARNAESALLTNKNAIFLEFFKGETSASPFIDVLRNSSTKLSAGAAAITRNPFTNTAKQFAAGFSSVGRFAQVGAGFRIAGEFSKGAIRAAGEVGADIGAKSEANILKRTREITGLFNTEIRALRNIIKDGKIINLKLYKQILKRAFKRTGNELLELSLEGIKSNKLLKILTRTETRGMKLSRYASKSMQWGTKIGGYITSPSSLAADAISKTVARITSKVESIGEELANKLTKWIKAGNKGLEALEDEFVKTGGVLFESKWIMGYKVLTEDEIGASILIQFKNQHPNVLTKLSTGKLTAFIESQSKGRWYINNIARSRGGRSLKELGIEGKLENLLGMLPIAKINEIVGFASFSKSFVTQIKANSGTLIWHTGDYIKGFEQGLIQGIINEGIKGAVALGTRNQYAKQVLEGGFGAVSSGTSFGAAFSSSFASGAQSMKDTFYEDNTKAGNIVKNVKPLQSGITSLKGL